LFGGSKPNFQPHPDDVASAAEEGLPDGTVLDLIDVLCQLSREHGVDWQFSHDYDLGPIGFIRGGVCDGRLREQVEAFADLGAFLGDMTAEAENAFGDARALAPSRAMRQRNADEADDADSARDILRFPRRSG
jgi:hypothetical protein